MLKAKLYFAVVVLCILGLLASSCTGGSASEVKNAADARDAAIAYLEKNEGQSTPGPGIKWQEEDITPPGLVGATAKEFTSDEWAIKVSYPVVAPESTVYEVVVSSVKLGWRWKGTVEFDGTVTELSAFKQMSKEESQRIAEEFVKNNPTFTFDGIEDTLELTDTWTARCPYCWVFVFEFDSANAGYGDRTGEALAKVITHHRAVIAVEQLEVTSAVMDEKWDMINQLMIEEAKPEGMMTVAELLENPLYGTEVTIFGTVDLLSELFCPCFELTSDGQAIQVWYDLMTENDGTERPPVDVQGINNGDKIIVTGELKGEGGIHYNTGDFWATEIVVPLQQELEIRLAPIHDVQVNIAESYPPQVIVYIKGGLSDGCTTFHELTIEHHGNATDIEVTTQRPKGAVCTEVYGFFEKNVNLGSDFTSGETYTVNVNDKTASFVMQ